MQATVAQIHKLSERLADASPEKEVNLAWSFTDYSIRAQYQAVTLYIDVDASKVKKYLRAG